MGQSSVPLGVIRRIKALSSDKEHGAAYIGRKAVSTLALAAEMLAPDLRRSEAVKEVARLLSMARPAMASVENMAQRFVQEMECAVPHLEMGFDLVPARFIVGVVTNRAHSK